MRCLVLLLALVLMPAVAPAQGPRVWAVLVGISTYADPQILPRPHAEADAAALYDLLRQPEYLGIDKHQVRLLLGGEDRHRDAQPATRANFLQALEWLQTRAGPDDLALIAFFCQGTTLGPRGDRLAYLAADSTVRDRRHNTVLSVEIGAILDRLRSRRLLALLDVNFHACRGHESFAAVHPAVRLAGEFLGDDDSSDHLPLPGRQVFLASNGQGPTSEAAKHGLFAQVLFQGLQGAADAPGDDADGLVTSAELANYLRQQQPALAPMGQSPVLLGLDNPTLVLTRYPAGRRRIEGAQAGLEQLARTGGLPAELAVEGRTLLERSPRRKDLQALRRAYLGLAAGTLSIPKLKQVRTDQRQARELPRHEAEKYAQTLDEASDLIQAHAAYELHRADLFAAAIRGLYARVEEKVPAEVEARLGRSTKLARADWLSLLADARQHLGRCEELTAPKDRLLSLQLMMAQVDRFSAYVDPDKVEPFGPRDFPVGVGLQIRKNAVTDLLEIITPTPDSPAHRADLQAGDVILTIGPAFYNDGQPQEPHKPVSTRCLSHSECQRLLLGRSGSKVRLTIQRDGVAQPFTCELKRGYAPRVTIQGVARKPDASWDHWLDQDNRIGYIRITYFGRSTTADLKGVLQRLSKVGLRGLVLDLRFNPGGLLDEGVKVASLFLGKGQIVTVRPRIGKAHNFNAERDANDWLDTPLLVLINEESVSGSEMLAAALQDHKRAILVGARSHGKGSVTNINDFDQGEIMVSTALFHRPAGPTYNRRWPRTPPEEAWGVRPDPGCLVELSPREREDLCEALRNADILLRPDRPKSKPIPGFRDVQLEKAVAELRRRMKP